MRVLAILVFAFLTTILQISFFSNLPIPLSEISIPIIVISYSVFTNRPTMGALWALVAGLTTDIHGIFVFGTELLLLLLVFYVLRIAFHRVITNSTLLAIFLLTALGILIHWLGLIFFDGIRVLFGNIPYIISFEQETLASLLRTIIMNGAVGAGLLFSGRFISRRFERTFLTHS